MELEGLSSLSSLKALSELLALPQEDDDDDNLPSSSFAKLGPGHIGPAKQDSKVSGKGKPKDSKDIWDKEEVAEGSEYDDTWDTRQQPEYEIIFKQQVGTEDIFLGMSRKDPSTACCEDLLIKIKLPGTKLEDVTLDIKEKFLDLRSPKYKLGLHLPHPVDSKNGKAQFISDDETLEVSLTMKRELDFINFF
ncbi:protein PIH1D3 [Latimeria chalumnae]|uniref:Dynein axonemal assembly factor 6 n=1 Tax=Latimeria chalumnae TaxID=7897 RepID=M3XLH3_LATCH|nr:PREDICTED: protein PIH1D3 [Latimeria chalumnae]XP_014347113.1 PREDICTED: protein PIH1D3 [Latimeria chalumnae]|eukprot:XP_006001373.1 PREDICTED: protein PIH1D3 [Latimeria chalumnae]